MANIRSARRSGRIFRGGRSVRESLWVPIDGTNTTLAAGSTAALLTASSAGLLALRPFTIVRSRGFMHLESDQTAGQEEQAINYGECVVSDQAVLIGVTSVPTPTTDKGSDLWYVFQALMASHGAGTVDSELGQWIQYDSRAMRKVEDGSTIVTVVETELAALTSGVGFRHTGRLLIKLH